LLKELTSNAETEKADLKKRQANLEQELQKLQSDRTALAQQIDADVLARYEKLIRSKGDMAIVPVQGGNCGGCHLHIPPQLVHDARGSDELVSCEYCGRILYWPRN
jgi:predicted  nucleic acid-binding Zn-ribbon protein